MDIAEGMAALYEREHLRLVGALSLYCGDAALGEELAHEALVRACERWESVSGMAAPGAWLYRVAINLANSHFRRQAVHRRLRGRMATPDEHVDGDVADAVTVRQAVARLPRRQRQALVLRFYLGLSPQATAREMGITASAVTSLTHRAIAELRTSLGDDRGGAIQEVRDAGA